MSAYLGPHKIPMIMMQHVQQIERDTSPASMAVCLPATAELLDVRVHDNKPLYKMTCGKMHPVSCSLSLHTACHCMASQ